MDNRFVQLYRQKKEVQPLKAELLFKNIIQERLKVSISNII
jgi:hypothetical protein